jgi:hypothetical protein
MPQVTGFASFADVVARWLPADLVRVRSDETLSQWDAATPLPGAPASVLLAAGENGTVSLAFRSAGSATAPPPQRFELDGSSLLEVVNAIRERFGFDPLED